MLAWQYFVELVAAKRVNVTNEEEMRYQLLKQLEKHNEYGYTIEPWMERYIIVSKSGEKRKKAKPDIQFEWQIVVELKAFMEGSEYSLAGAKKELIADFDQMHKYEGTFAAGFSLCVSNKFKRSDLIPDGIPKYNYPVRVVVSSTVPE